MKAKAKGARPPVEEGAPAAEARWMALIPPAILYAVSTLYIAMSARTNFFPFTWGDAYAYFNLPMNIAYRGHVAITNFATPLMPPLYPLALLPSFLLSDDYLVISQAYAITNALLYSTLAPLAYVMCRSLGLSAVHGCACGLLFALWPPGTMYAMHAMAEPLLMPLLTGAIFAATRPQTRRSLLLTSAALTGMVLTKTLAIVPALVVVAFMVGTAWRGGALTRLRAPLLVACAMPLAAYVGWGLVGPLMSDCDPKIVGDYVGTGVFVDRAVQLLTDPGARTLFFLRLLAAMGYLAMGALLLPLVFLIRPAPAEGVASRAPGMALLVLATTVALILLNVLSQAVWFSPAEGRYVTYGRYIDGALPSVIVICYAELACWLSDASAGRRWWVARQALLPGVVAFVLFAALPGYTDLVDALGLQAWYAVWPARTALVALLAGVGVLAVAGLERFRVQGVLAAGAIVVAVLIASVPASLEPYRRICATLRDSIAGVPAVRTLRPHEVEHILFLGDDVIAEVKQRHDPYWYLGYVFPRARFGVIGASDPVPHRALVMHLAQGKAPIDGLRAMGAFGERVRVLYNP